MPFSWSAAMAMLLPAMTLFGGAAASANPVAWKKEGWAHTDFSKRTIEWNEIISGGPPKDGIPPIDAPLFRSVAAETAISDVEPVVSLEVNGDARAYPIRVLIWHEIANDTVGGVPVTVTYCPLCNAAIVFDRRLDGQHLTFGTSGKLRKSDLVMYDRQTESWWQQFTGEAIVGSLTGKTLTMIPARLESFSAFKARHPNGRVLFPEDPTFRAYGRNPYEGYDSSAVPFLYRGELPSNVSPMIRVVVVRSVGRVHVVTLDLLRKHRRIEVEQYVLTWRSGQASALDRSVISRGREVGNVVVQKASGGTPTDVPYDLTFAFVAHAFHSDSPIIDRCDATTDAKLLCGEVAVQ
jgi:hypothetical protein